MLRVIPLTVLLSAALACAAPPATAPQPEESIRPQLVAEQAAMSKLDSQRMNQLLGVAVEDSFLRVSIRGLGQQRGQFAVQVPDLPGFVTLRNDGNEFYTFDHWLLTENDTVTTHTTISVRPDYLQISRDIETPKGITNIALLQSRQLANDGGKPVRLIVSRNSNEANAPPRRPVNVTAATFTELIRDQSVEAREFLLPILRDLGAADVMHAADPARAWQALGTLIPPDPAIAKQIDELLPRLNSDDFTDRVKAEEQLQALGPAGATELRRRDLTKLPIDTRSSIDNVLRMAEPLTPARAKELASDVPFLLDTLVLTDPRLVAAAAQQLQAITGKPIELPADLSAEERQRRIASYTATLGPATQPTPARTDGP
jgi:hypothetical protein